MRIPCHKPVLIALLTLSVLPGMVPVAQAWPGDGGRGGRGGPAFSSHYAAPGYRRESLPLAYTRLALGGLEYFYWEGMFYRSYGTQYVVVSAPAGAVVTAIPAGYQTFVADGVTYFTINGVTYRQVVGGYEVVPAPAVVVAPPPAAPVVVAVAPGVAPFQLSIAWPLQMLPENWDVMGLRLDVIIGRNRNVGPLDIGLFNETTGQEYGIQVGGLWNDVHGDLAALQIAGLGNSATGDRNGGIQIACFNTATSMTGLQIGVVNHTSGSMQGWQIGAFNVSEQPLRGVQIGVVNLNQNGPMPCMPVLNCGF